jgi:hypothetical protein
MFTKGTIIVDGISVGDAATNLPNATITNDHAPVDNGQVPIDAFA